MILDFALKHYIPLLIVLIFIFSDFNAEILILGIIPTVIHYVIVAKVDRDQKTSRTPASLKNWSKLD